MWVHQYPAAHDTSGNIELPGLRGGKRLLVSTGSHTDKLILLTRTAADFPVQQAHHAVDSVQELAFHNRLKRVFVAVELQQSIAASMGIYCGEPH